MNEPCRYIGRKQPSKRKPFRFLFLLIIVAAVVFLVKEYTDFTNSLGLAVPAFGTSVTEAPPSDPGAAYTHLTMEESNLSEGTLVLVNYAHEWNAFGSTELESIYDGKTSSYYVCDMVTQLRQDALTALNSMLDAFYADTGLLTINVVAGYRTYADQQELYNKSMEENGETYTSRYVAQPGCSEHHAGLAVDLSIYYYETGLSDYFRGDGDYAWFAEHCWEYGYVLRYETDKSSITGISWEPWHFRYVGIPHAYQMATYDLCLEEYLEHLQSYPYDGEHLEFQLDGISYEIYYCAGYDVYVPEDAEYAISGDNVGGFIVTVTR